MSEETTSKLVDAASASVVAEFEARADRYETPCGDGVMVWRAWGSGPPLLLLHGAQGSWAHWIRNVDALASRRRVWAPDMPGCGDSAVPPRPDDGDSYAEVMAAGLRQLFGQALPIDVVGFSLGGVLAAHMAAIAPETVRRLILVDTGGLETPLGSVSMVRVRGLAGEARREAQRHNLLQLMLHDPDAVDAMALHLQATDPPRGRVNPAPLVIPDRLQKVLPHVRSQIDAIWGEWDRPHPDPAVQAAALRHFRPDLDFRVIPGVGHWAMYEGAGTFNRTLVELLDQPLRPPPPG